MAGFVEFFYNIIPGGLFLTGIYLTPDREKLLPFINNVITHNELTAGSIFVILSLFIGFFFQMLNKIMFKDELTKEATNHIKTKRQKDYEEAKKRLVRSANEKEYEALKIFYFMHNYLWAYKKNGLTEFFNANASLWSNIMAGSLVLVYLNLVILSGILNNNLKNDLQVELLFRAILILLVVLFAYLSTKKALLRFYDTVLTTFLVATDKKLKEGI